MTAAEVLRPVPVISLDETKPIKPMTPKQSRARAEKLAAANDKVADAKASAAIKVQAAQRKAASI